jgi:hypothetical protein
VGWHPQSDCRRGLHLPLLLQVVSGLRDQLHFASPADPRLTVPDRKQKGQLLVGRDNPELRLLEAVKQAVQLNTSAGDAFLKEVQTAKGIHPGTGVVFHPYLYSCNGREQALVGAKQIRGSTRSWTFGCCWP